MNGNRDSRKKIVCIHHGIGIGGASLELLYLLQKLDRDVFHVRVLCLHDSEATDLFRNANIDVRVLHAWREFSHTEGYWIKWHRPDRLFLGCLSWFMTAFIYGKKILLEEKPDIVYLNSTPLSAWAVAANRLNIPVVSHVRESIAEGYVGVRKFVLRSILRKNVDRLIAVSDQNARILSLREQTETIYGFIHFDQFNRNITRAEVPRKSINQHKVALYLGGGSTIKGFEVIVDALEYLDPEIMVLFGGYYRIGRSWKDLPRKILKPNLARAYEQFYSAANAVNIGLKKDVTPWIAACDVLVCPFVVPQFARPIVEAGAMAKPVVASNLDGMEELVVDEQTGILVPPGNAKALAHAINRICGDEMLAARMGEAGYQRTKVLFDGEKNTRATFKVFQAVLANSKTRKCNLV